MISTTRRDNGATFLEFILEEVNKLTLCCGLFRDRGIVLRFTCNLVLKKDYFLLSK